MNKRIVTLTLLVSLAVAANAAAAVEGAWTATTSEKKPDRIHFNLTYRPHSNNGMTMAVADFSGLTAAQVNAAAMTPVNFQLRREAGTAAFEGTFRNGKGAGQFTFTGNPGYLQSMRGLGIDVESSDRKKHRREHGEEESLLMYALFDVSTAFVKSMIAEGYRATLEEYMEMRIFDITPEYVREMRALGYKDIDAGELVATKIHKVTPDYIRSMRAAGWNLSLDELQSSSIHGATPKFAEEMKKLGYGDLDMDDLVAFRIHKVTPELIRELRELGYDKVDSDHLVAMRIHKVTPQFIRELKAAGYSRVPVEKLISMRIAGVDANYLKKMNGTG